MQNSVQKIKSVRFWSGILSISADDWATWVNLGALKDANLNVSKSISEIVVDNAKLPPKVKIDEAVFSANLYEVDLENFQTIDWLATYSSVDTTPVAVVGEALGTGWTIDTPIKLENKNWDNTEVASITIDEDWSALVLDTDYRVYVDWGYTYILPMTAQTGVLDADYTYTPIVSSQQLFQDIIKTLATNRFKFENTDENWKVFGIEFYEGYNRAGIEATFLPDDTTDDAMNIPIEIKAYPVTWSQNLFRIYDEQNV